MKHDIGKSLEIYKKQLADGYIQQAYVALTKHIAELRAKFPPEYKTGGISFGYLDYTYFPFFNDYLREHKLRFGIVLNHEKLQIELWLMGQNAPVQAEYWDRLKDTKWNEGRTEMPKYAVLEVYIGDAVECVLNGDMTTELLNKAVNLAVEIEGYLKSIC